jgi:hypothetical protein
MSLEARRVGASRNGYPRGVAWSDGPARRRPRSRDAAAGATRIVAGAASAFQALFALNVFITSRTMGPESRACPVRPFADTLVMAGICEPQSEPLTEVLCDARSDNRPSRFAGISFVLEPSDGLEPSTPSL